MANRGIENERGDATLKKVARPGASRIEKEIGRYKESKVRGEKGRGRRTSSRTENRACCDNEHSYLIVVGRMTRFSLTGSSATLDEVEG